MVATLHSMGLKVTMLTGDNRATARAVAAQLGIVSVIAEVLPAGKADQIRHMQVGWGCALGLKGARRFSGTGWGWGWGGWHSRCSHHAILVWELLGTLPPAAARNRWMFLSRPKLSGRMFC